jgi:DcuC family C4-dicarboxylate transporter
MSVVLGLLVIVLAIYAICRQVDVRLSLLLAGLALGTLAGSPMAIVLKFLQTFSDEKFVVPICTALGFAYVLRLTECDQHLVQWLVRPLRRVRFLLIPGTIIVGYLVNMPIVSQTSTAVVIGPVVIPILLAARIAPATIGAALLLGCSIGGELLNPAAPELRTVIVESERAAKALKLPPLGITSNHCVERILPLGMLGLLVATFSFWFLNDRRRNREPENSAVEITPTEPAFQVNYLKALVPVVPLLLLYIVGPPLRLWEIPFDWLENMPRREAPAGRFDSRLVGAAMLVGVAVAALVVRTAFRQVAGVFFEGAGYGFTHIISLIVAANCFGEGIQLIGIADWIGGLIHAFPTLLLPLAGMMSLGFAVLCGSGMATTQSLFAFFAEPALVLGMDPAHVGAVVSLSSAAGRTMSPAAAVALACAAMTQTDALALVKRVAVPLFLATVAMVSAATIAGL